MNSIVYLFKFQVHYQRVFVEFVALLTKIWPKNIDFYHSAKCWRQGCSELG